MKPRLAARLILVLACLSSVAKHALADTATVSAGRENSFADKVLVVYMDREARLPSHVLVDASIQKIGDQDFLVGTGADTKRSGDWKTGLKIRVRWIRVTAYIEFTKDEYEKYLAEGAADRAGAGSR